ncbi:pre-mRNA-splicing factor CWC22 homolog [Nephila pilipes]|uniref:Pre-mRNA-splicing factor CWC22 homolog n=1 Tax=Nephila pilipes TaxID=299642 RepID=A0A8X6Q1M8_NEPPI|nr:pre-mRNA-splicing factor CWC22 homolog [Nephila pilipes]
MSPGKHKSSRDEARYSSKDIGRSESHKKSYKDSGVHDSESKKKDKRDRHDKNLSRDDDSDNEFNRKGKHYKERSFSQENNKNNSEYKRKETKKKSSKCDKLDKENDDYNREFKKRDKYGKDKRLSIEKDYYDKESKRKEKKNLHKNEDYDSDEITKRGKEKKDSYNMKHKRVEKRDKYDKIYQQEKNATEEESDMSEENNSKSERIRSAVHKIENKSRHNEQDGDDRLQNNINEGKNDNYESNSRVQQSRYNKRRAKRSYEEKDNSWDDEQYKVDSKRRRNINSENAGYDSATERRYRYFKKPHSEKNMEEQRNEEMNSSMQENIGENMEVNTPSDSQNNLEDKAEPLSKRQKIGNINMRTGGAYIPPARLRMMQENIKDKGSEAYQRIAWEALKKSIVGMTNKINSSNITEIIPELFKENIIRGRGILARAIMQAQAASPTFTRVYAALVAIINTKFPEIGDLILKRLIIQYKRGFRRNDKTICMTAARFLAHLLNQEVAHEVLILEMVTHLLENPTEDSVEISIAILKECGKKLSQLTPRGMRAITQRVRDVLHEGTIDMRVRYMIEVFFAVQKDGFKDFEVIPSELDLVEEDDKYTHLINLDDAVDGQDLLNVFKFDPDYTENEEKYKSVVNEILGDSSDEEESGNEADSEEEEKEDKEDSQQILDMTETNLVCLRRKIYLTVQSSLDFEECAHKLLKLELKPGQILEMCYMILDCCAQQRTYEKFYGLLAQRFCQLNKIYVEPFTEIFENSYKTIHRLETNKLRNVAKFFAHLLYTDAISWNVLSIIKLNEDDTTSSSRIFIKILFQELCEYMGLPKLNERVKDVTLQEAFDGLFPRDHPHNTRFAINFFTSIGLGGLTDELREHLKNMPKNPIPVAPAVESPTKTSSDSSSSSTSSSSSSSTSSSSDSSDSSSSSSSSDSEDSDDTKQTQKKQQKRIRK